MKAVDLTGQRFGRLVVLVQVPSIDGKAVWSCQCDCGATHAVAGWLLRNGTVKSCGCYRVDRGKEHGATLNLRHGEARNVATTTEYRIWATMLSRCRNPSHQLYRNYGGRGIVVCDRWLRFENFLVDMGRRPGKMSIDRINVNGNYEPGNCRWATAKQQARNQRGNRWVEVRGARKTLAEWLELTGTKRRTFYMRVASGLDNERALFTPSLNKNGQPENQEDADRLAKLLHDLTTPETKKAPSCPP